ncbi:macro domain-containing protein [Clostridium sp. FP2]|uniref:macro domain-containing protein n=1 Tax=Clostridium sp. FP2 TaxID=2724481 RepID=UPI0013E9159F|nr:macro domain-containing protein [Clostridium sp. FP2]MBZ9622913.1 macro domain-containing protein [Clostridium sp. FP2]
MIKIVEGNILNATEDVICQQVNCQGVMGAGLAKQIRNKYPEVYPLYKRFCEGCENNDRRTLLGEIQTIPVSDGKVIANLFGQYNYGRDKQYTDYKALRECLEGMLRMVSMFDDSIAIPYEIGCGLAGGDWNIVYKIIEDVFKDYEVTLYKFK